MTTGLPYFGNDPQDKSGTTVRWHYGNSQLDSLHTDSFFSFVLYHKQSQQW